MRKIIFSKKQRERFVANAKALLLGLAARQKEDEFIMQTRVGRLTLHPVEHGKEELGTVFARFEDPEAAHEIVDCNPFSGKWNHHYFGGWTVETAISDLSAQLRMVLA